MGQQLIALAAFVKKWDLPFFIIAIGMIIMLLWAGAFKMTYPGAETITPLVTHSPLMSWHFKVFGAKLGSFLIGVVEVIAASLLIAGFFYPALGIFGSCIAVIMFFLTSTMLLSTPDITVSVKGISYLNNLGLFLFKDIIALGASFFLITHFGEKAALLNHHA
jgi:uncharacterized membrane protein YkgB